MATRKGTDRRTIPGANVGKGSTKGRRANGDARPYYDAERGCWELRVELPPAAGGGRRRKHVRGDSPEAVRDAARLLRAGVQQGLDVPNERRTFAQLVKLWLPTLAHAGVSAGTIDTYERVTRLYLLPTLGPRPAAKVQHRDVRALLHAMLTRQPEPLEPATVQSARRVGHRIYAWAIAEELLVKNPFSGVPGPKVPDKPIEPLTVEEAQAVYAAARGHRHEVPVLLCGWLGLRRSEALGVAWSDVDLDAVPPRVTIRRQVQRLTGRGLVLIPLKTAKSVSVLPLPPVLVEALRRQRVAQVEERLRLGARPGEEYAELVCTTPAGGPVDPRAFARSLDRIAVKAGLPGLNPHRFRHSLVGHMADEGVRIEVVSEILRHASIRTTKDRYGKLLLDTKADALDLLAKRFEGRSGADRGAVAPSVAPKRARRSRP